MLFAVSNPFVKKVKSSVLFGLLSMTCALPAAHAAIETLSLTPEQNWMPTTDLSLPRQMKTGTLENHIRYVLMPSRRSKDAVAIRLGMGKERRAQRLYSKQALLSEQPLADALREVLEQAGSNQTLITGDQEEVTLILVGDFTTRDAEDAIDRVFTDVKLVKKSQPSATQLAAAQPESVEQTPRILVATRTSTDALFDLDEDSKMSRKESLSRQLANQVLAKRIENALVTDAEQEKVAVSVEEEKAAGRLSTKALIEFAQQPDWMQAKDIIAKVIDYTKNGTISAQEFSDQVQQMHQRLKANLQQDISVQADEIALAVHRKQVYLQPSDELRLFEFHVAHMSEADLNQSVIQIWSSDIATMVQPAVSN
ncbi:signal recognition particle [Vibrio navarrensis]